VLSFLENGPLRPWMSLLRGVLPGQQQQRTYRAVSLSTPKTASGSDGSNGLLSWPVLGAGAALLLGVAGLPYSCLTGRRKDSASSRTNRRGARTGTKRASAGEESPLPIHLQPLLVELPDAHKGKVQSLDWVDKSLVKDEDGDEAHEHLGPF